MYFSRIVIRETAPNMEEFWKVFRNPYTLHQSIWQLFSDGADRKRDFLYRLDYEGKHPLIYAVSCREPWLNSELWHIESKPYEPKIKDGMQLAFMLRVNPIRAKRDEKGKQHRHDVVMETKTRLREQGIQRVPHDRGDEPNSLAAIVQEEGSNWLLARTENCGFNINPGHIRVDGYQQHRVFKGKANKPITFSTLDINGILTVTDPGRFTEALFKGIGPAKGFGCGMLMIRRA